ncbi:TPA: hypothetical protein PC764_002681 [Staphylococcus aureus]|uniref:hypothetical protein n=1 Tax=Staphylococcaceae TaxID=90964 RepID=UPI0003863D54|nr:MULTISPECIES: hypothetical protein [Staphylococcaceae]HBI9243210.1 hypothetical protein [Staphylococcus aureus]EPZ05946.1 hypothetical protein M399_12575 [Staphylococcus aureus S123]EZV65893.1 hypothetical protein V077_02716 [Staphylococcus aureus 2010-60-6511-39]EZX73565.1 hypothetical protein V110_02748 [Staphylococcus aureus Chi-8]EZY83677.1 hypothetical protein V101_02613 [Staphylococcus aureus Rd.51]
MESVIRDFIKELSNVNDLGSADYEEYLKKYLISLSKENFYILLSAWDIGRDLIGYPESTREEIEKFGGKKSLLLKNAEDLKGNFPYDDSGTFHYFLSKKPVRIKEALREFLFLEI